jgi:hypothetical protein
MGNNLFIAKELPSGVDALLRYLEDDSLTALERDRIFRTAKNLSMESDPFGPRASRNIWDELVYTSQADTTISGTTTETIMCPDPTLAANYLVAGRVMRYTLLFDVSTVITTPGTLTYRLRYGGVAGTLMHPAPTAITPDSAAASTQTVCMLEWWISMRADGTSGSTFVIGRLTMTDLTPAKAQLDAEMIPAASPAAVTINTTTANALSSTSQSSVTTGSHRTRMALLEAMN